MRQRMIYGNFDDILLKDRIATKKESENVMRTYNNNVSEDGIIIFGEPESGKIFHKKRRV